MEIIISGDKKDRELSILVVSRRKIHLPEGKDYFEVVTGPDDSKIDKKELVECLAELKKTKYNISLIGVSLPNGKKDVIRLAERESESLKIKDLITKAECTDCKNLEERLREVTEERDGLRSELENSLIFKVRRILKWVK